MVALANQVHADQPADMPPQARLKQGKHTPAKSCTDCVSSIRSGSPQAENRSLVLANGSKIVQGLQCFLHNQCVFFLFVLFIAQNSLLILRLSFPTKHNPAKMNLQDHARLCKNLACKTCLARARDISLFLHDSCTILHQFFQDLAKKKKKMCKKLQTCR